MRNEPEIQATPAKLNEPTLRASDHGLIMFYDATNCWRLFESAYRAMKPREATSAAQDKVLNGLTDGIFEGEDLKHFVNSDVFDTVPVEFDGHGCSSYFLIFLRKLQCSMRRQRVTRVSALRAIELLYNNDWNESWGQDILQLTTTGWQQFSLFTTAEYEAKTQFRMRLPLPNIRSCEDDTIEKPSFIHSLMPH